METTIDFRAYLDSYDLITIAMSQRYYEGKSNAFYLRYPDGQLRTLEIKSIEKYNMNETIYRLQAPKDLVIGTEYQVLEEHAKAKVLEYSMIVKTKEFEQQFGYAGNDLGATYATQRTKFALWAPTAALVNLEIRMPETEKRLTIEMERTDYGVFRACVEGDLDGAEYTYLVRVNGVWRQSLDPYGKASTPNHQASVVINPAKVKIDLHNDKLPKLKQPQDAVIYEANVRDFSVKLNTRNAGKYLGMMEPVLKTSSMKPAGFDYLRELGITHVQLMPVHDFYTVDEHNPAVFYNWGYDPIQWMVPEGSFASDVTDPYSRIRELKQLVAALHEQGIRVILDVVFNHCYSTEESALENTVPNYFYRRSSSGAYSNGSFCGNDLESNCVMGRKYIIDACVMWMEEYGVDGFRFDLMGITDVTTMNQLVKECRKIKPDALFYGEGWNMPTMLPDEEKAMMYNHAKLPYIAFFNDRFRDIVKGKSGSNEINVKGYASGDTGLIEHMKTVLIANVLPNALGIQFDQPSQAIQYIECHDNATCWDKLKECCKEDDRDMRMQRQKLMIGILMVAQGIPFLHMGQEFCRTKNGVHNSYMSSDAINGIDWERKDRYQSVVDYTKDMIALRRRFACFRLPSTEAIKQHVSFTSFGDNILIYQLKDLSDEEYEEIWVVINPTNVIGVLPLEDEFELIANESGLLSKRIAIHRLLSNPSSMIVMGKRGK